MAPIGVNTVLFYLSDIDTAVERPRGLKVLLHPLLQRLRNMVCTEEVFEVSCLRLIDGTARIHALNDGCYVAEDECVHQS